MSVNLTTQLLTFSKGGKPVRKKMDVRPVLKNTSKFALSGSRCACRLNLDPNLWWAEVDEELGNKVELVRHGEDAIGEFRRALLSGNPFDLVILDLTIKGGMGGQETIRKLREIDTDIKAIVSSGYYSDDPVISEYREYGSNGLLSKPYTIEELEACLAGLS